MTSFVVTAPTPATAEEPIANGAFWPEIDPAKIRAEQRIDNNITPVRLRFNIVEAIAATNQSLRQYRLDQQAIGTATLAAVEADQIDGVSIQVQRYQRAVGSLTKALVMERYKDIDTTAKGDKKADVLADPIDDHRRDWHNAIADIVGRTRVSVELI